MRLILLEDQMDIDASQDEKYNLVIAASTRHFRFDEIRGWVLRNLKK